VERLKKIPSFLGCVSSQFASDGIIFEDEGVSTVGRGKAIGTVLIIGGIGCSPFVRLDVALFAAIGYLLLSIHAYLAAKVCGEFKLSYLAAGPTELRLMLIGLTLAMLYLGHRPGFFGVISGFDLFVGAVGTILVFLFLIQTFVTVRQLGSIEP
jgi:hypothetical protein